MLTVYQICYVHLLRIFLKDGLCVNTPERRERKERGWQGKRAATGTQESRRARSRQEPGQVVSCPARWEKWRGPGRGGINAGASKKRGDSKPGWLICSWFR